MGEMVFGALVLAGLWCLGASFYYRRRRRHALRERSRTYFAGSLALLAMAAVLGWW